MRNETADSRLCFLPNERLQAPLVEPLDVTTKRGERIGTFDGVIVDPARRRVRYLVVDKGRWFRQQCLIPLPPAQVDAEHHTLSLDVDDAESLEWQTFNPARFPPFTDDDLVDAMFAQRD
jgi:sporulation protein YlmC with PRC-barrel domain